LVIISPPFSDKILPYGEKKGKEIPNFDGLGCADFVRHKSEQYIFDLVGIGEKEGVKLMYVAQTKHLEMVEKDLVEFIHRVATDKKASPAEIAVLPEIARVLYDQFPR